MGELYILNTSANEEREDGKTRSELEFSPHEWPLSPLFSGFLPCSHFRLHRNASPTSILGKVRTNLRTQCFMQRSKNEIDKEPDEAGIW